MERVAPPSPTAVAEAPPARTGRPLRAALTDPETIRAAGLAAATLAANGIAVVFTVVFARLLGAEGYGSLAAVVSTFLILSVPGSALQVATARETALGRLGQGERLAGTLSRWSRQLAVALAGVVAVSVLLREPLAAAVGVDQEWAAAATLPTGLLWLLLSIQRGALQGLHAYRPVGASIVLEAAGRLTIGLVLVGAGADVTGAYLGTPLSMAACAAVLAVVLRRRLAGAGAPGPTASLRGLVAGAGVPVLGLTLLGVLQNVDVIVVKHQIGGDAGGSYAAATVAAKLVVWVAVGVALYLLPEAVRRSAAGRGVLPVLARALAVVGAVAVPMLVVFLAAPELLLRVAFGDDLVEAADTLFVLGLAMTLLACSYLAVQCMLALGRRAFVPVLAVVALGETAVLAVAGDTLMGFAWIVLGVQAACAVAVLALVVRSPTRP